MLARDGEPPMEDPIPHVMSKTLKHLRDFSNKDEESVEDLTSGVLDLEA